MPKNIGTERVKICLEWMNLSGHKNKAGFLLINFVCFDFLFSMNINTISHNTFSYKGRKHSNFCIKDPYHPKSTLQ